MYDDIREDQVFTELCLAAEEGDTEYVKIFCDDMPRAASRCNGQGQCPLWIAAARGHLKAVKYLYHMAPRTMQCVDVTGRNALQIAAEKGHTEVVLYLEAQQAATAVRLSSKEVVLGGLSVSILNGAVGHVVGEVDASSGRVGVVLVSPPEAVAKFPEGVKVREHNLSYR